jgi:hypothetical protein
MICRYCGRTSYSGDVCALCAATGKDAQGRDIQWGRIADLNANRGVADQGVGGAGVGTVRLQIQLNKDSSTLSSEVVENAGGVTITALDAGFERLLNGWAASKKLKTQARECYEMHKTKCRQYTVGNSYSIYFDEGTIKTAGRPKGGYRLDIENIRVAPGRPNFV